MHRCLANAFINPENMTVNQPAAVRRVLLSNSPPFSDLTRSRSSESGTKMLMHSSLVFLLSLTLTSSSVIPQTRSSDQQSLVPLTAAINDFSVSLFNRLSQEKGQENVFVSPLSVSTALSMLLLGTRSTSESQLSSGLKFDGISQEDGRTVHQLFHEVS